MSVVDKKQWQLYEMLKRLLELDVDNNNLTALEAYNEVVGKIDKELFKSIADMINKNIGYVNESLEEQLKFLKNLERVFSEYDCFRKEVADIYNKYSHPEDSLNDISLIRIDEVRARIQSIKKYLANETKIKKYRLELDSLNKELIGAMKQTETFQARMGELDEMLERRLVTAKGERTTANGEPEEITFLGELAEALEVSGTKKVNDSKLIDSKIQELELKTSEVNERLKVAQICYDKSPSTSEQAYLSIMNESVTINYKLVVLKIMQLIKKYYSSYEDAYDKRITLRKLIEDRAKLLEQLGFSYLVDPTSSLGLSEQLELMQAYKNNCEMVSKLRETIDKKSSSYSMLVSENDSLLDGIGIFVDFLNNNDVSVAYDKLPNQVVRVTTPISFNYNVAKEKTSGVINRIAQGYDIHASTYSVSPELEIDAASDTDDMLFIDDVPFVEDMSQNLFDDQPADAFIQPNDELLSSDSVEVSNNISSNLFADYSSSAFAGPALFNDKQDEETIFEPNNENASQINADLANSLDQDTLAGNFWPSFV